jgi:MFS family permease
MTASIIESDVPARLDRLPWSGWHMRIITALGTSWILDGLEVTLVGSLSGILQSKDGLGLSDEAVTGSATAYLLGAVIGALFFGHLTDRHGRRKLFLITLATYSLATLCSGFAVNLPMFLACRFVTGLGIGGEYAAINSAVDELVPSKVRGTVDLIVNATFWAGAIIGSFAALLLMGGHGIPMHLGWRLAFGIGGVLGMAVLLLRLAVPESPRWLMLRGRDAESHQVMDDIERHVVSSGGRISSEPAARLKIRPRDHTPWKEIFSNMVGPNRSRSILGLVLMAGQAFFFNAVFFTFGLIAKRYYHVPDASLPLELLPFAVGSFLGPLMLGALFDKIGRKPMITAAYGISGVLLLVTAILFGKGVLQLTGMKICFAVIFFVASSAASAAYLTVSEIFPLEIRAIAIAIFYSLGTAVGGVGAPLLFGILIEHGRIAVAWGYFVGAALMITGAICEYLIGVEAAGQSLESVSKPLQAE